MNYQMFNSLANQALSHGVVTIGDFLKWIKDSNKLKGE